MTAQAPAPKASGAASLPASLSSVPLTPQSPAEDDFTKVMLQALNGQSDDSDAPTKAQTGQPKTPLKEGSAANPVSANFLLSLLAPAQPTATAHKSSDSDGTADSTVPTAQEKSTAKEASTDPMLAGLILALLAPPLPTLAKAALHKSSVLSAPVGPSVPPSPPAVAQTADKADDSKTDKAEKNPPLPAQTLPAQEAEKALPPTSGTSVANTNPRMSFSSESNEIAGRMEQKLPPGVVSAVSSADTGGPTPDGGAKSSLNFSWHEAPTEPLTIVELSAKATAVTAPVAEVAVDAPVRSTSTAPLEQLEKMISREVINVRQAGADTLGVTLKLDANTQLFLQLTNHNGQVQASVRLDRGSFSPEETQWAQLQQSLARQNVELLPMSGGSSLNFQQHPEGRSRHPATREEWPATGATVPPAKPRQQQKEQNRARKNWESWA
jgi:hypothetical protein